MGEEHVVAVVEQTPWWLEVLRLLGPAAAAMVVLVWIFRPFLKAQQEQVARAPTREDLAAVINTCNGACANSREAEGEKTRTSLNSLTRTMDRVADGLDRQNGDMAKATKAMDLLPYRISLSVGRAVHSKSYVGKLEEFYTEVEQLRMRIDMTSDPDQAVRLRERLDALLQHPPGRED